MGAAQVVLQAARVADVTTRIVDDGDERVAVGMTAVALDVLDELIAELPVAEARAGHLDLDNDSLALEQEIDPRGAAGSARARVLRANIAKHHAQDTAEEILDVVLVADVERGPVAVSVAQRVDEVGQAKPDAGDQLKLAKRGLVRDDLRP